MQHTEETSKRHKSRQEQNTNQTTSSFATSANPFFPSAQSPFVTPNNALYLQSTVGNRAVQRMLSNQASPTAQPSSTGASPVIQAKLEVGAANDRYEREADQVARLSSKASAGTKTPTRTPVSSLQRQEAPQVGPEGGTVSSGLESQLRNQKQGGSAVPDEVRGRVEQTTGADLSSVRVHKGQNAQEMNSQLGAKAFTKGNHIYLGNNQSEHDVQLMAHELTHTIQQGATQVQRTPQIQRQLDDNQKDAFQDDIDALAQAFHFSIQANDRADDQLRDIGVALMDLADAVKVSQHTDSETVKRIKGLFGYATTLAGLGRGGGYIKQSAINKAQEARDTTLIHMSNMGAMYKHQESLVDPSNVMKGSSRIHKGKIRQKQAAYHVAGAAANLLTVPYFLMMHGTEGVAKAQGLDYLNKLRTLKGSHDYFDPVFNLRRDGRAVVSTIQADQPQAAQVFATLDRTIEKLLKKRDAQVRQGSSYGEFLNEKDKAKEEQNKFYTKGLYTKFGKNWGPK